MSYKETPIGKIPEDWNIKKIMELFDVKTGTTPSTKEPEYWENGTINWITPTDLSKLNEKIHIAESERKITQKALEGCNLNLLPKGSIILSTRAPVGYVAVVTQDTTFNQGCKGLEPKNKDSVNSEFYAYYLKFKKRTLETLSGGSTFKELSKTRLEHFIVPYLAPPEQKKIAEILSTVDKAIELTDEIIAQTELLKKGLMQRLLTRGIGHKEFKFSKELGCEIPKEWVVARLGDVCTQRNEIIQPSGKGKYKFIGLEHINSGETKVLTSALDVDVKSSKFRFYPGDILYGKLRPYLDKAVLVDFDGICSTDLLVLISKKERILAEFLIYVLHSSKFLQHAISTTSGTNHPRTSWKAISKFKFGLPPLSEQRKIAEILSTVDKKLELERKRKQQLQELKKGLMQVLLTGKVRVKV